MFYSPLWSTYTSLVHRRARAGTGAYLNKLNPLLSESVHNESVVFSNAKNKKNKDEKQHKQTHFRPSSRRSQ